MVPDLIGELRRRIEELELVIQDIKRQNEQLRETQRETHDETIVDDHGHSHGRDVLPPHGLRRADHVTGAGEFIKHRHRDF